MDSKPKAVSISALIKQKQLNSPEVLSEEEGEKSGPMLKQDSGSNKKT